MSFATLVSFATFLFEDDDLTILFIFENLCLDDSAFDVWRTKSGFAVVNEHEHLLKLNNVSCYRFFEAVDDKLVTLFDGELSALCVDGGFHFGKANNKRAFGTVWQELSRFPLSLRLLRELQWLR